VQGPQIISAFMEGRAMQMAYKQDQLQQKILQAQVDQLPQQMEMQRQSQALQMMERMAQLQALTGPPKPQTHISPEGQVIEYRSSYIDQQTGQEVPGEAREIRAADRFKPKPTRSLKQGDEIITQEFDDRAGQWNDIASASRYKTGVGAGAGTDSVDATGDKGYARERGKGFAKQMGKMDDEYASLQRNQRRYNSTQALLSGYETGRLTPFKTEVAAWADSVGMELDKNLPPKQAFEALMSEVALSFRNPAGGEGMPGALSDKDLAFLKSMVPSLSKTKAGNALIIEVRRRLDQARMRDIEGARDYEKQSGSLDAGFYDAQSKTPADLFGDLARPKFRSRGNERQLSIDAGKSWVDY
jgi:hypothetical protein